MRERLCPYLGFEAYKSEVVLQTIRLLMISREQAHVGEKEVVRMTINLQELDDNVSTADEQHYIQQLLGQRGLLSQDFGYSVFHPKLERRVLETGTYYSEKNPNKDLLWCLTLQTSERTGKPKILHEELDGDKDLLYYID